MKDCPITFNYKGSIYTGTFEPVNGAGISSYFHLIIDNYFRGQLWHTDAFGWQFSSNDNSFVELVDFFGGYITAYYESEMAVMSQ